jgi:tetratricopeptide (TPR) repeat protein
MKKVLAAGLIVTGFAAYVFINVTAFLAERAYLRGEKREKAGDRESALLYYQKAQSLVPARAEYQRAVCRVSLSLYQPGTSSRRPLHQAKDACARAVEANPAYPYHWLELGQVLSAMEKAGIKGQPSPEPFLLRAREIDPDNPRFLAGWLQWEIQRGKTERAWETFIHLLHVRPRMLRELGPALLKTEGDFERLSLALGGDWQVNVEYAIYLLKVGHLARAEEQVRKISPADRSHPWVAAVMADILSAQQKYEEAEKVLAASLKAWPRELNLLTRLADVQLKRGNPLAALQTYEKALALQPEHINLQLAVCEITIREGLAEKAWEHVRTAAGSEKVSAAKKKALFLKLARMLEEKGDLAGAVSAYRHVLDWAPEDSDITRRIKILELKIKYQKPAPDTP